MQVFDSHSFIAARIAALAWGSPMTEQKAYEWQFNYNHFSYKRRIEDLGGKITNRERIFAFGFLSPVQTVMIVDDRFNDLARLNTNYHALSSTTINYLTVWTHP